MRRTRCDCRPVDVNSIAHRARTALTLVVLAAFAVATARVSPFRASANNRLDVVRRLPLQLLEELWWVGVLAVAVVAEVGGCVSGVTAEAAMATQASTARHLALHDVCCLYHTKAWCESSLEAQAWALPCRHLSVVLYSYSMI